MAKKAPGKAVVRMPIDPLDLVSEVRALSAEAADGNAERLEAAFKVWSQNTRRAFRSDILLWCDWCRLNGVVASRASGRDVAAWVRALAAGEADRTKPRAVATIERYLVNVGSAHRLLRLADPTADELVRFELKATRKALGVRQRQALGLRFKGDVADLDGPAAPLSLVNLLKACRRDELGLRDSALLRLAYDTGVRRSELVRIDVRHIEGPDGDGAGQLFVPSSKTDKEGEGAWAYLAGHDAGDRTLACGFGDRQRRAVPAGGDAF